MSIKLAPCDPWRERRCQFPTYCDPGCFGFHNILQSGKFGARNPAVFSMVVIGAWCSQAQVLVCWRRPLHRSQGLFLHFKDGSTVPGLTDLSSLPGCRQCSLGVLRILRSSLPCSRNVLGLLCCFNSFIYQVSNRVAEVVDRCSQGCSLCISRSLEPVCRRFAECFSVFQGAQILCRKLLYLHILSNFVLVSDRFTDLLLLGT